MLISFQVNLISETFRNISAIKSKTFKNLKYLYAQSVEYKRRISVRRGISVNIVFVHYCNGHIF